MKIKLFSKNTRNNIIIGVIYRHPNSPLANFQEILCNNLEKLTKSNLNFYISGDININILECNSNNKVNDYINSIYSCGAQCIITKPTRITETSATVIDHIYTNQLNFSCKPGILVYDLSDHLSTFVLGQSSLKI